MNNTSQLDEILTKIVDDHIDSIIDDTKSLEERNELKLLLKEKRKAQIIDEIRNAYELEWNAELEKKQSQVNRQKKIEDLKELLFTGFILAFVVGLAVNQVSEILNYVKGLSSWNDLLTSIILSLFLIGICLLMYWYSFYKEAIKYIKNSLNEEKGE